MRVRAADDSPCQENHHTAIGIMVNLFGILLVNIYVGNLSYEVTDTDLRNAFSAFGGVTSAKVISDNFTGKSKGFGFVEMASNTEAQTAIAELNGKDLKGRAITVNEARPKRQDGGGNRGGGFGGGGRRNNW